MLITRYALGAARYAAASTIGQIRVMSSARDGPLAEKFAKAQQRMQTLQITSVNQGEQLKLYALYKQATVGAVPADEKPPSMFNMKRSAMYNAWKALGDQDKESAMHEYIATVERLAGSAKDGAVQQTTKMAPPAQAYGAIDEVRKNLRGKIFNIQLNRANKKNALTPAMYNRIGELLRESANDESTSITVISALGDMYSSGNDLSNFTDPEAMADPKKLAADSKLLLNNVDNIPSLMRAITPEQIAQRHARFKRFVASFIDHPKPLVALVQGPAVGIAVTTLGLCDVVYCSDKATFHTPFSSLGQSPEGCSALIFPYIMGFAKANEVLLFGKKLTAHEALERSFVSDVIPHANFEKEAWARVEKYAQLPPQSMRYSKQLIRGVVLKQLHDVNNAEVERLEERWTSDECMQAIMTFFQQQMEKKQKAKL